MKNLLPHFEEDYEDEEENMPLHTLAKILAEQEVQEKAEQVVRLTKQIETNITEQEIEEWATGKKKMER